MEKKVEIKKTRIGMNKRGWIRVIEAFVAVLLITGVLLVFLNKRYISGDDGSEKIYGEESTILREIQVEDSLRGEILNQSLSLPTEWNNMPLGVKNRIEIQTPNYLKCEGKICEISDDCLHTLTSDESIYAKSVIISSNNSLYNPRQLKLFCWKK
jgi:hypothetical protein